MTEDRAAILHRMVLPSHECPYGVRAKAMLEEADYKVDDQQLTTREAVEALFSVAYGVRFAVRDAGGPTTGSCRSRVCGGPTT